MKPKARQNDIVIQELPDELLIYNTITNKAVNLNKTAASVWNLCDGNRDVAEISKALAKDQQLAVARDMVWLTLENLKQHDLLTNSSELPDIFAGLSRREVIKKVGLTSLIALPVISSLIAPTAAKAASGALLAAGAACTTNPECANNNCCNDLTTNTCTDLRNGGDACTVDCQCASNFCKTGFGPGFCL